MGMVFPIMSGGHAKGVFMDRSVLHQLTYGLFAVTTTDGDKPAGCIVNTVVQVTSEPATVIVSVNHDNYTNGCIAKAGRFAVSIFGEESDSKTIGVLGYHSGKDTDKFADLKYQLEDGMPVISDAVAYGLFKVISTMESSTHTVFLGEMYGGEMLAGGNPMSYAYYRKVLKGSSPKNAPTYEAPKEQEKKETPMSEGKKIWRCTVCGYVYDGDTPFEDLPETWCCPLCGAPKHQFEQIDA